MHGYNISTCFTYRICTRGSTATHPLNQCTWLFGLLASTNSLYTRRCKHRTPLGKSHSLSTCHEHILRGYFQTELPLFAMM